MDYRLKCQYIFPHQFDGGFFCVKSYNPKFFLHYDKSDKMKNICIYYDSIKDYIKNKKKNER